jgi:protein TonB
MTPPGRWCTLTGFCISALVHLAIAVAVLTHLDKKSIYAGGQTGIAVTLAMFETELETTTPSSSGASGQHPEQATHSTPEPEPPPLPEPSPAREPKPQSPPAPAPRPELEPAPTPEPEPVSDSAVKPKPEPEPAPEPKPVSDSALKPKPEPTAKTKQDVPRNPQPRPRVPARQAERTKPKPASKRSSVAPHGSQISGKAKESASAGSATGSTKGTGKISRIGQQRLEKQYLAGLRRAIAKKRYYPTRARRTGKTGVATVYFVLDQQGRIRDARLDKSSGSSALDQAAVETLQRLARYKPIPEALGRARWPLRVPIRFALD